MTHRTAAAAPVLVREVELAAHVPPPVVLGVLVSTAILCTLYIAHRLDVADHRPALEPQSRLLPNLERFDRERLADPDVDGWVDPELGRLMLNSRAAAGAHIIGAGTAADPLRLVGQRRTCEYCGMRHTQRRRFELRTETVRQLAERDLAEVAGGHPTGFPTVCTSVAARQEFTDGCPSSYTNCINSCSQ